MARLVYREGSRTIRNLTPRPDDTDGLSTWETPDHFEPGTKLQVIDLDRLKLLNGEPDAEGHVGLRPKDGRDLAAWMAARDGEVWHPMTKDVFDAIIDTVRAPK